MAQGVGLGGVGPDDGRCPWCNEPWVAHDGQPVRFPALGLQWRYRPNCDCYGEHKESWVNLLGTLHRVKMLKEHRPPRTAQQIRAEEDALEEKARAARLTQARRALAEALREAGLPVPEELGAEA